MHWKVKKEAENGPFLKSFIATLLRGFSLWGLLYLPRDTSYSNSPAPVARVRDFSDDCKRELIGSHVARSCQQLEHQVRDVVRCQEGFSGHENDNDRCGEPEDHPAANEISKIAEDNGTLGKKPSFKLVWSYSRHLKVST